MQRFDSLFFKTPRYALLCMSLFSLSILLFNSCDQAEQQYPNPSISFKTTEGYITEDTSVLLGDSVVIGISAETNSNVPLTHFHFVIENDGLLTKVDTGIYINSFSYDKLVIKGVAENEKWSFYVRDMDGRKSDTISITFTKDEESIYGGIQYVPSVILGAQNNSSIGGFYSFLNNEIFTLSEAYQVQSSINLICFYDFIDGDDNTISSPGANIDASVFTGEYSISNWTTKNTTRFIFKEEITVAEFDACSNDSLIVYNNFEFITGKRKAKNLAIGDIYAFSTEDGKNGLFKVINVLGTDEGNIEISIKMQD